MPKGEKGLPVAKPNPCELALVKVADVGLVRPDENRGETGGDDRKRGGGDIE